MAMLRNRVLLMVALLAITGTMAAMAYTTANVHSPATGTVVHTNVALLALNCNDGIGRNDEVCESHTDGRLHLNFAKGLGTPGTPGTPPGPSAEPGNIYYSDFKQNGNEITWVLRDTDNNERTVTYSDAHPTNQYTHTVQANGCVTATYRLNTGDTRTIKVCRLSDFDGTPGTPGAPGLYGFQPGSTYTFNDLVKVTNNSNDTVDVSVAMDPALSTLTITVDETHLGPGDTALVSFSFTVPDEWGVPDKFPTGDEQYPFTGTMVINAVATAP